MGFRFNDSEGDRIVVVTKKGEKEGGLPKGIIVPTGRFFLEKRNTVGETWRKFVEDHHLFTACVIHASECENHIIAIRTKEHYVNRFGIFLSKEDPFTNSKEDYDVTPGTLKTVRVRWNDFETVSKLLS